SAPTQRAGYWRGTGRADPPRRAPSAGEAWRGNAGGASGLPSGPLPAPLPPPEPHRRLDDPALVDDIVMSAASRVGPPLPPADEHPGLGLAAPATPPDGAVMVEDDDRADGGDLVPVEPDLGDAEVDTQGAAPTKLRL